jgi:hypothetical protein
MPAMKSLRVESAVASAPKRPASSKSRATVVDTDVTADAAVAAPSSTFTASDGPSPLESPSRVATSFGTTPRRAGS